MICTVLGIWKYNMKSLDLKMYVLKNAGDAARGIQYVGTSNILKQ